MPTSLKLIALAAAAVLAATASFADEPPSQDWPPRVTTLGPGPVPGSGMATPTDAEVADVLARMAGQARTARPTPPRSLAAAPIEMKPLLSLVEPLTVTVRFTYSNPNNLLSPIQIVSLEDAIAQALFDAGLPLLKVTARPDGHGTVSFRTRAASGARPAYDLGSIKLDVFPGPSARGSVSVPGRRLVKEILGRRLTVRMVASLMPHSISLDRSFAVTGEALVPASQVPPSIYKEKKARVNFWSAAAAAVQGEGSPLKDILKNTELEVGLFKWDGQELAADYMGLRLSQTKLDYAPTVKVPLPEFTGLKLKGKMKERVVLKEFAPPSLKTPEGGLMVAAEYSSKGLKQVQEAGRLTIEPVGEESRSLFFNGAGTAEGERLVTTAPQYKNVLEPSFGRSGGGRELYAERSRFCEGMFAGQESPRWSTQDIWYDRFETAEGDMLLLRMNYLKATVSLSLSDSQIQGEADPSQFAHLVFYICPGPAAD